MLPEPPELCHIPSGLIETTIVGPGISLLAGSSFQVPFQSGEAARHETIGIRITVIQTPRTVLLTLAAMQSRNLFTSRIITKSVNPNLSATEKYVLLVA
jgi:hypothetical protein